MSIVTHHNSGFFSCCSVKLNMITDYINKNHKLPKFVDSSREFKLYNHKKTSPKDIVDITYDFFKHYDTVKFDPESQSVEFNIINEEIEKKYNEEDNELIINNLINYKHQHQYADYRNLDYKNIMPVIKKYFTPSITIQKLSETIRQKYNVDISENNNNIAVYYRGTDKIFETKICDNNNFYKKIEDISNRELNNLSEKKSVNIIVQTDSSSFKEYMLNKQNKNNEDNIKNKKIIILDELTTSTAKKGIHYKNTAQQNYDEIMKLFAIFLMLAKCKHIICGSSNGAIWIMFYRSNGINVHQFYENKWLDD